MYIIKKPNYKKKSTGFVKIAWITLCVKSSILWWSKPRENEVWRVIKKRYVNKIWFSKKEKEKKIAVWWAQNRPK